MYQRRTKDVWAYPDDEGNLYLGEYGTRKITEVIDFGITHVCGVDTSNNVIGYDYVPATSLKFYKFSGFDPTTITDSFSPASVYTIYGMCEDNSGNVVAVNGQSEEYIRYTGWTDTVLDTFASPGNYPRGASWDRDNNDLMAVKYVSDQHWKRVRFNGFSSTIVTSVYETSACIHHGVDDVTGLYYWWATGGWRFSTSWGTSYSFEITPNNIDASRPWLFVTEKEIDVPDPAFTYHPSSDVYRYSGTTSPAYYYTGYYDRGTTKSRYDKYGTKIYEIEGYGDLSGQDDEQEPGEAGWVMGISLGDIERYSTYDFMLTGTPSTLDPSAAGCDHVDAIAWDLHNRDLVVYGGPDNSGFHGEDTIYHFDGFSTTLQDSFVAPISRTDTGSPHVYYLFSDMTVCDTGLVLIGRPMSGIFSDLYHLVRYDGISNTMLSDDRLPEGYKRVHWDGRDLWLSGPPPLDHILVCNRFNWNDYKRKIYMTGNCLPDEVFPASDKNMEFGRGNFITDVLEKAALSPYIRIRSNLYTTGDGHPSQYRFWIRGSANTFDKDATSPDWVYHDTWKAYDSAWKYVQLRLTQNWSVSSSSSSRSSMSMSSSSSSSSKSSSSSSRIPGEPYGLDSSHDKFYKFHPDAGTILDSFTLAAGKAPTGFCFDGSGNVVFVDNSLVTGKVYKCSGFSSTISDSFSPPNITNPRYSIQCDGTNFYIEDELPFYPQTEKYSGFSSTISDSWTTFGGTPDNPDRLDYAVYDSNLYTFMGNVTTCYAKKHSGFTSTITDSFTVSSPYDDCMKTFMMDQTGRVWGFGLSSQIYMSPSFSDNFSLVCYKTSTDMDDGCWY
jgi:hypothetical protein